MIVFESVERMEDQMAQLPRASHCYKFNGSETVGSSIPTKSVIVCEENVE